MLTSSPLTPEIFFIEFAAATALGLSPDRSRSACLQDAAERCMAGLCESPASCSCTLSYGGNRRHLPRAQGASCRRD
eukprot:2845304-Prymnesium_polylepis.1